MDCDHVVEESACIKCGLIIENIMDSKLEFTSNCPKISSSKNNILDTLEDVPMDVISKAKANISLKQSFSGKKVRNDAKNTFIIVYSAYLECGYSDFNPQQLAQRLGLSRKDVNCCLKIASGTSLTSNLLDESLAYTSIVILSPVSYLDILCKRNNIEDHKEQIEIMRESALVVSRTFYVACAIIKKFCEYKNINMKCFSKTNKISDNALKNSIQDVKEFFPKILEEV